MMGQTMPWALQTLSLSILIQFYEVEIIITILWIKLSEFAQDHTASKW